jgi:signal transduction histidine kinase
MIDGIQVPRFRRHLFITVSITMLLLILGGLATRTADQVGRAHFEGDLPNMVARLVDATLQTKSPDANTALQKAFVSNEVTQNSFLFWLTDSEGKILLSSTEPGLEAALPLDWASLPKPDHPFMPEFVPKRRPPIAVVRMGSDPQKLLVLQLAWRPHPRVFGLAYLSLFISVLLASALSFVIIFSSMRSKAKMVDQVIDELQRGNLKARIPIGKLDETGQALIRFNRMADEIEMLVERLRSSQQSRMTLLQDLAHDLRTPIASLQSLLETLSHKGSTLSPELHTELTDLSLREIDYFARLVEDLLFVARAGEPRYQASQEPLDVADLLDEELSAVSAIYPQLKVTRDLQVQRKLSIGDTHLLRRLFRNGLDNAFSFARNTIFVSLRETQEVDEQSLEIRIQDDGPGITEEIRKNFGVRKSSRVMTSKDNLRLSVGLGSVIMKTIAELHRGDVFIQNVGHPSQGSELIIRLPLLKASVVS